MPIWNMQTSVWSDSVLPRDAFTITPHFNDQGVGSDPQGLCDDLAAAISAWAGPTHQVIVKAYDAQGAKPVYPAASTTLRVGAFSPSPVPREVALCLSFFSGQNVPRKRGRIYAPAALLGFTSCDVRPVSGQMDKVRDLAPIFQDLGGVDVDWVVWSKADGVARPVTNWWVDDEWDTIRSRGLRATTRIMGTTSEG